MKHSFEDLSDLYLWTLMDFDGRLSKFSHVCLTLIFKNIVIKSVKLNKKNLCDSKIKYISFYLF